MANSKQVKTPNKSDRTALICLISLIVFIVAVAVVLIVFWSNDTVSPEKQNDTAAATAAVTDASGNVVEAGACDMTAVAAEIDSLSVDAFEETDEVTDYVKFTVTGYGEYVLKLRPDVAPISVENFKKLVKEGFYDGSNFHRIMSGFMIQGGAPQTEAQYNALTAIKGEFSANGVRNDLSHIKGVISMARTTVMDSATSQFFISNDSTNTPYSLDGKYAAFGYVVAGLSAIDVITNVPVGYSSSGELSAPKVDVIIERATFVKLK